MYDSGSSSEDNHSSDGDADYQNGLMRRGQTVKDKQVERQRMEKVESAIHTRAAQERRREISDREKQERLGIATSGMSIGLTRNQGTNMSPQPIKKTPGSILSWSGPQPVDPQIALQALAEKQQLHDQQEKQKEL